MRWQAHSAQADLRSHGSSHPRVGDHPAEGGHLAVGSAGGWTGWTGPERPEGAARGQRPGPGQLGRCGMALKRQRKVGPGVWGERRVWEGVQGTEASLT